MTAAGQPILIISSPRGRHGLLFFFCSDLLRYRQGDKTMIYPKLPENGSLIGIAAPSAGVGEKLDDFEKSLAVLHEAGFRTIETPSVRNASSRSGDAKTRGRELTSLFENPDVDMVAAAAGGDFLNEMIPYAGFEAMRRHPKWMIGASDPTGILYPYTVRCDVASMYGMNAGSFDLGTDWDYIRNALMIIKGETLSEKNFPMCMSKPKFMTETPAYDTVNRWKSPLTSFSARGRCIGGCIDVLKDLIGTPYDATADFVNRYADDGQIFYFDNFSMSAENFYRTLKQFRYAGWFAHTRAVIIGRVCFPSSETGMSYEEAAALALEDIPYVTEADVGHTIPCMIMINGAMLTLEWSGNEAQLTFELI